MSQEERSLRSISVTVDGREVAGETCARSADRETDDVAAPAHSSSAAREGGAGMPMFLLPLAVNSHA